MHGLGILSDEQLMNAYKQAVENKLDLEFITILTKEIDKRGLEGIAFLNRSALFIPSFSY